ncbi:MAG: hypothetical protein M1824_002447, partial [Vezdaea acicularis]
FKAQLSSAFVVLGVTPTILSALGPSVGEISLLSSTVPLLSLFITIGAPAVFPTRILDFDSSDNALKAGWKIPRHEIGGPFWTITLEYLFAAAAAGNVLHNSYQLSVQTVFTPVCNGVLWPFFWTLLPIAIHGLIAIGNISKLLLLRVDSPHEPPSPSEHPTPQTTPLLKHPTQLYFSWMDWFTARAIPARRLSFNPWWYQLLNMLATCLGPIHVIFGVLIFSSLEFICVGDAVGVLGRYAASAIICRVIVVLEFARMRRQYRLSPLNMDDIQM